MVSRDLAFEKVHPEVHFGHYSMSRRSEYRMADATFGLQSTQISECNRVRDPMGDYL